MEMENAAGRDVPDDAAISLSAHCTSPDRTVFIEPGNADAWIATDLTVDCME